MANHRRLRQQWAHEHRAWQANWHQVVFSDESRFNLWDYDGRARVSRSKLPSRVALSNDMEAKNSELWSGCDFLLLNLLRIEDNLNSNRYFREMSEQLREQFSIFNASLGLFFSRLKQAHMLQRLFETSIQPNICNFFLGLLIRQICCLLSLCGIWLVSVSLVIRVLQFQKMNFGCSYKQFGVRFHRQTCKICLTV